MSRTGLLKLSPQQDEEVQGWPVLRLGSVVGVYMDDTTPNLDTIWLPKAVAKYKKVFVGVATGQPRLHHEGCINLYEAYPYGMQGSPDEYFALISIAAKRCEGFIAQWRWTGMVGKQPPTRRQRLKLMAYLLRFHKRYIFLY